MCHRCTPSKSILAVKATRTRLLNRFSSPTFVFKHAKRSFIAFWWLRVRLTVISCYLNRTTAFGGPGKICENIFSLIWILKPNREIKSERYSYADYQPSDSRVTVGPFCTTGSHESYHQSFPPRDWMDLLTKQVSFENLWWRWGLCGGFVTK